MSSPVIVSGSSTGVTGASGATITKKHNVATLHNNSKKVSAVDGLGNVYEPHDIAIGDILGAIPKHCYERSAIKGLSYVFRDMFFIGLFGYLANTYISQIDYAVVRVGLWAVYIYVQSLFFTGKFESQVLRILLTTRSLGFST